MADKIPQGWTKTTLKDKKFFEIVESGVDSFEGEKHYLSTSSIVGNKVISIEQEITYENRPSRANMQPVKGSVWFAKMKGTLKVLEADEDTEKKYILSTGFCGIKPKGVLSKFLKQVFLSDKFNSLKDNLSTGSTQQGVGNGDLDKISILIPPELEQEKIAQILSTVDENIEDTNKVIIDCEHIKKGMMQTLFIKGIPGRHQKFKQTIIGEIPEEWELKKLTEISSKIGDGLHATPKYVDSSDYYFINGNNLLGGSIIITESTKCVNENEFNKYYIPLTNRTILMSINGTIGNLANFNNEKVILGKSAAHITLDSDVDKNFIYYLLQTPFIRKYYKDELTGTTIRNLSLKSIRNTPIPLPSISEQREISEIMIKIDERILYEKKKKKALQINKQALMQKLLSGEMRVKV